MKKLKILSIFGTRPEANKMAPLVKAIEADDCFESIVCVSAQHRDMLDQSMKIFGLKANYDLNIMKEKQTLSYITSSTLSGVEEVIGKEKPDLVLVHGDTTTSFAASLAAFYSGVKIGHVEAGLRTYDKLQPFPEEINRRLTGVMADFHFSPTKEAKQNLLNENIDEKTIFVTGNTAIDCIKDMVKDDYIFDNPILNNIDYKNKKVIAVTAHRRENLGKPLYDICNALKKIANEIDDCVIVYAVHANPVVKETAHSVLGGIDNVYLTAPLDLLDMYNLFNRSYMVMTDSGGIQEEAPSLDKPVLVLRNVTERPEGVAAGTLKIVGTDTHEVFDSAKALLTDKALYEKMAKALNPFGDGFASKRIIEFIKFSYDLTDIKPEGFSL